MNDGLKSESAQWLKAAAAGVIIFAFIRIFFFTSYIVEGESMMPTLEEGNKLVVYKIGFQPEELERFDVIVFHANKKEDYVKRVIGLPGDEIEYRNDELFINGKKVDEPFLEKYRAKAFNGSLTGNFTLEEITGKKKVPEGQLFVMGDNRHGSWDSRHFGYIPVKEVVGKVNLRYWPLEELDMSF
ncbi:signal peptidase [Mesobacillus campisalis]|uniref:Signal peptidase I n=1 Tax=Mesobacillus campisalis TaxID=1408103 RepID=A0A0M2SRW7_9BACI|nr:signal peptidase I [Mesobacillus campisalis]KKK36431.1 signal peptidase [Mesobacillus campisalis]